jgi:hypothetical protein
MSDMKQMLCFLVVMYCVSCSAPVKEHSGNMHLHHINVAMSEEFIGNGGTVIAFNDGLAGIEESGSLHRSFFFP